MHDRSNLSSGNLTGASWLTTSSVGPFAAYALLLFRAGYMPIPIVPGEKRPALGKGWEKHRRKTIADQRRDMIPMKGDEFLVGEGEIALWVNQYPNAGLGVLCGDGLHELVTVDIDEETAAGLVHSIVPGSLVAKRGRRGHTLFYRNGGGVVNENFRRGTEMLVEILAGGRQTVLPPTIHPDTGQPYYNLQGFAPLHDVPIGSLPLLTVEHVDALRAALITHGFMEALKPPKLGEPEDLEHLNASRDRYAGFARRKLEMQAGLLAHPREHGRRQGANNTAFALGPYVAHGLISEEEIWQSIDWASQENGKYTELDGNGRRAVRQAFEKGLSDGMKNPLPKLTDDHPHAQRQAARAGAPLPPPPVEYVPRVHMNADGSVETRWGPPDGSGGATALATWSQPQTLPGLPQPAEAIPDGVWVGELLRRPAPPRQWTVEGKIPHKQVTLGYGDGGVGKTTILIQLAFAAGGFCPWLGMFVKARRKVLLVTGEDEIDEMHYRFEKIAKRLGVPGDHIMLLPLAEMESPALATADRGGALTWTALFDRIVALITEHGFSMVILDPAADLFAGDEIDRKQVSAFMVKLRKLAVDYDCTIILSAHPSVDGMKTGRGSSGSTAWNNKARSRLYFEIEMEMVDGVNKPTGNRFMTVAKTNRAEVGVQVVFKWDDGIFTSVGGGNVGAADVEFDISQTFTEAQLASIRKDCAARYREDARSPSWVGKPLGRVMDIDSDDAKGKKQLIKLVKILVKANVFAISIELDGARTQREFIRVVHPGEDD